MEGQKTSKRTMNYVSVDQLDRLSASDAEGCEFEPRRIRHKLTIEATRLMLLLLFLSFNGFGGKF